MAIDDPLVPTGGSHWGPREPTEEEMMGASPLAMPFPSPAAGVHHGTDFVSGLEHFPQLARGLNYVEVTPLFVAWDVHVGADGSRIETDQRAEFVCARFGMGVMTPQVGRAGERGGVHRIDMQPTNATTPNPNVVKMQQYAASHPASAEAKVQELERRWDADPLLRRSHDRASAHDRLDAPKGGPNSKHCDELLKPAETDGRSREVGKDAAWASGDADGNQLVTARTKFMHAIVRGSAKLPQNPDPRRDQQAMARVPMRCTYSGNAPAMGALQHGPADYTSHDPLPVEVEGGGEVWVYSFIRDRIELSEAALRRKIEITYEYMKELNITLEMTRRPWHFELPPPSEIVYHPTYVAQRQREAAQEAAKAAKEAAALDSGEVDEEDEGEEAGDDDECGPECWRWGNKSDGERQKMADASKATNGANATAAAPFLARYFDGGAAAAERCLKIGVCSGILAEVAAQQIQAQQVGSTQKRGLAQDVKWKDVEEPVLESLAKRAIEAMNKHMSDAGERLLMPLPRLSHTLPPPSHAISPPRAASPPRHARRASPRSTRAPPRQPRCASRTSADGRAPRVASHAAPRCACAPAQHMRAAGA